MDLWETKCVINEDTFRELKKYLMPTKQRLILLAAFLLAVCFFILGVLLRSYSLMGLMVLAMLALALEYILILNSYVKSNVRRMQETVHARECAYTTSFSDAGFHIKNHLTNAQTTIAYEDIKRLVETTSYYVLFTKAEQFGLVNKSLINDSNQQEALRAYLKQHYPSIR